MTLSLYLLMLIMLNMLISRSLVCRQRVLVGQWREQPSSALLLAGVTDDSSL